jgi:hypothetical protein
MLPDRRADLRRLATVGVGRAGARRGKSVARHRRGFDLRLVHGHVPVRRDDEKLVLRPVLPECAKDSCFAAQWAVGMSYPRARVETYGLTRQQSRPQPADFVRPRSRVLMARWLEAQRLPLLEVAVGDRNRNVPAGSCSRAASLDGRIPLIQRSRWGRRSRRSSRRCLRGKIILAGPHATDTDGGPRLHCWGGRP